MKTRNLLLTVFSVFMTMPSLAGGYRNPVIPGFHPDPSVCRAGDDFYLVNSSFQYFPGVPVFHSRDLVNWEQIGHCLTTTSQLPLDGADFWGGIYAPTIRYHDGVYYMITTNCSSKGNFYVYTTDPAGQWSEPVWVDRPGIDPDLFFDDDGKCYVLTSVMEICEIDVATGKLLSDPVPLWYGTGGRYPEGPHLYKKDGWYYMMIAEGGTEYGHKETIARSRNILGPYESNPDNPILTHTGKEGAESPIQGTGHADLVEAPDGSWWMVCLAFRPQSYNHHLLGRETFLAPVVWNGDGWPVVNGGGTISLDMNCPTLSQRPVPATPERDEFTETKLGFEWNTLCRPHPEEITLSERPGWLRLRTTTMSLDEKDSPVFICRRQQDINFTAGTLLDFSRLGDGATAGITVYMSHDYHYDIAVTRRDGVAYLSAGYTLGMIKKRETETPLEDSRVWLRASGRADVYSLSYSVDGENYVQAGRADTRFLSSETAGGFTGVYLGMYAWSENETPSAADFDWWEYRGEKEEKNE